MLEIQSLLRLNNFEYSIVEGSELQLDDKSILDKVFKKLDLEKREPYQSLPYENFHVGHEKNHIIRNAFYSRVTKSSNIESPEPKSPLPLERFPLFLQEEILRQYRGYITCLKDPHRIKPDISVNQNFSQISCDKKPLFDYYFTTIYALHSSDVAKEATIANKKIRDKHTHYKNYFDAIDKFATSQTSP